jgi:hypothetical protein
VEIQIISEIKILHGQEQRQGYVGGFIWSLGSPERRTVNKMHVKTQGCNEGKSIHENGCKTAGLFCTTAHLVVKKYLTRHNVMTLEHGQYSPNLSPQAAWRLLALYSDMAKMLAVKLM